MIVCRARRQQGRRDRGRRLVVEQVHREPVAADHPRRARQDASGAAPADEAEPFLKTLILRFERKFYGLSATRDGCGRTTSSFAE